MSFFTDMEAKIVAAAEAAWAEIKADAVKIEQFFKPVIEASFEEVLPIAAKAVLSVATAELTGGDKRDAAVAAVFTELAKQAKFVSFSVATTAVQAAYNYFAQKANPPVQAAPAQ